MKIDNKKTMWKYPFSEPVLRKMMCASQMLWNSGRRERETSTLGWIFALKASWQGGMLQFCQKLSAPQSYNALPTTDGALSTCKGKKKHSSTCTKPAQGWTEQGHRKGWKTRCSAQEFSLQSCHKDARICWSQKKGKKLLDKAIHHLVTDGPLKLFIPIHGLLFLYRHL